MNTTFYLVNVPGDIVTKVAWNQNMENYIKHRFPGFGLLQMDTKYSIESFQMDRIMQTLAFIFSLK